jgi:hypothetical protein
MKFQSCFDLKSFGIDFKNLEFEISIPLKNESRFDLLANEISIDRTDIIKENFRENLPMMIIDTKFDHPKNQSIILIEQENDLNSLQTANVTLVFHHQVTCLSSIRNIHCCCFLVIRISLSMSSLSFNKFFIRFQVELIFIIF